MSRHYRLIGLTKLTKHRKGLKKRIQNSKDIFLNNNAKIENVRKEFEEGGILDTTFSWHRKSLADGRNTVTFYENVVSIRAIKVKNK
ncbi:hypothetical protein COK41_29020 [Bacillus cereus]|nr:hypothetical protein COK41_29020 [Bacillus cereus]